jgi:hypothetical protein
MRVAAIACSAASGCASAVTGADARAAADGPTGLDAPDLRDAMAGDASDAIGTAVVIDVAALADAVDARDARLDVSPDVPTDAPRDAPPEGTCATAPVRDIPSRHAVRFHFPSAFAGYVATDGMYCAAFTLARVTAGGTEDVPRGLAFQCICECAPPAMGLSRLVAPALSPTPLVLRWDARAIRACNDYVDCAARGWPGAGYQLQWTGASQPVSAGRYQATFAVYTTLPYGCVASPTMDGTAFCELSGDLVRPGGWEYVTYGMCEAPGTPTTITAPFDLPTDGDVDVDVPAT